LLEFQEDYVTEGKKTTVYERATQTKQTPRINKEYIFDDSIVETKYYYTSPNGDMYCYVYEKRYYIDGRLRTREREEYYNEYSTKYEYFYDFNANLIKIDCKEYEKKYTYSSENLILIEYFFRSGARKGEYKSEKVENISGNIVYSPCYDFYINPPFYCTAHAELALFKASEPIRFFV